MYAKFDQNTLKRNIFAVPNFRVYFFQNHKDKYSFVFLQYQPIAIESHGIVKLHTYLLKKYPTICLSAVCDCGIS